MPVPFSFSLTKDTAGILFVMKACVNSDYFIFLNHVKHRIGKYCY